MGDGLGAGDRVTPAGELGWKDIGRITSRDWKVLKSDCIS